MRTFGGGPRITENDIADFERRQNIVLPSSYRSFLLQSNGGRPERDLFLIPGFPEGPDGRIHFFFDINGSMGCYNLDFNREWFSDRIPDHLLPIATTEGADIICMSLAPDALGAVYYWDGVHISPTYGMLYLVANSFEEFLEQLYRDEDSPRLTRMM